MFTLTSMDPLLRRLPPLRRRRLLRQAGDAATLTAGQALLVWLAVVLAQDGDIPPDQQDLVLEELAPGVTAHGQEVAQALLDQAALPVLHLLILDRRFARLTGSEQVLRLQDGVCVPRPPQPTVRNLCYDLTALFVNTKSFLEAGRGDPAATQGHSGSALP